MYNSTYVFSDFSEEEIKRKGKKRDTKSKHTRTKWVLCSEDWQDIVITYVPQLSNIPIEDNYADISLEEIKDAYPHTWQMDETTQEESEITSMIAYVKFHL